MPNIPIRTQRRTTQVGTPNFLFGRECWVRALSFLLTASKLLGMVCGSTANALTPTVPPQGKYSVCNLNSLSVFDVVFF